MKTMTIKTCEQCNKSFSIAVSDAKRGRGIFCGKSCAQTGIHGNSYKHGETLAGKQTKEYQAWAGIKRRTTSMNTQNSKYYMGRGITVCDRWFNSFDNFLADMGRAPSPKHSIDRIDNNDNYTPENCRWATHQEQMQNTRATKWIEFNGEKHTQEEWGRLTGIGGTTICKRFKRGWSIRKTLTTPLTRR